MAGAESGGEGPSMDEIAAALEVVKVVVEVPTVDLTGGRGGVEYVVQAASGELCATWTDFCRVVAPARSKRQTIIRAAAGGMSMAAGAQSVPLVVRVLDSDAAREHTVSLRERAPELVIA